MMNTFIIIGGGPAAVMEAARLSGMGKAVTVISEQFGGCMDIMGQRRLQSYCNELTLAGSVTMLEEHMETPSLTPTGIEFCTYVRSSMENLPVKKICGRVTYFTRENDGFCCQVMVGDELKQFYSDNLVLATGITSRPIPEFFSQTNPVDCFSAYKIFSEKDSSLLQNCHNIVILGGGNTAFQLADASAARGIKTSILAKNYMGIFPQETQDRFALRAPSQITIERIWKSQTDNNITPLGFYIYSSLSVDNDCLIATLHKEKNCHHISSLSYSNLDPLSHHDEMRTVSFDISNTLFISAIGTIGTIPENNFPQLVINEDGYVNNINGKTSIKGLYVAGMIAGARSVNTMKLAEYK